MYCSRTRPPLCSAGRRRACTWAPCPARSSTDPCTVVLLGWSHGALHSCAVAFELQSAAMAPRNKPSYRPKNSPSPELLGARETEQAWWRGPAMTPQRRGAWAPARSCDRGRPGVAAPNMSLSSRRHRVWPPGWGTTWWRRPRSRSAHGGVGTQARAALSAPKKSLAGDRAGTTASTCNDTAASWNLSASRKMQRRRT
jgi:hypothetical protein